MTTIATRLDQLPEGVISLLLSKMELPDQERYTQASQVANQTFRSSSFHQYESNILSKRYSITTEPLPDTNIGLLENGSFPKGCPRFPAEVGKMDPKYYFKKSSGSLSIERADQNQLTVTLSGVAQTISLPQDQRIYDFAIDFGPKLFAVSTSKGLQIYALEEGNRGLPKKIAEFARFHFHLMIFQKNNLVGFEPLEQPFSYSSQATKLSFDSPYARTHLLDNRLLYCLREGARKVGLFALRILASVGALVGAIVATSSLFSGLMTLLHVAGLCVLKVAATGAALAASKVFLFVAIVAAAVIGAFCIPLALYLAYRSAVLTFGKPNYEMNFGSLLK